MIKSLTSLRGLFILFIFFHHCLGLYPGGGSMAVAFFFVLGGYSMTLGYKDKVIKPGFIYRQYITKRFIKFYPLHWICLLVVLPLKFIHFSTIIFFINAALFQSWIPIPSVYFSFNDVSWYLADTLFFSLMFPFVIRWIVKGSHRSRALIALLFALIYVSVAIFVPQQMSHAILYINPCIRFADFVFGIYMAFLYLWLKEKPTKWWNNTVVSQMIVFSIIALLVGESCVLPDEVRQIAPVYWPFIGVVIIMASLSDRIGGGRIYLKTRYCNA